MRERFSTWGSPLFPPVGFRSLVDAGTDAGRDAGGHDLALDVAAAVLFAAAGKHIQLTDRKMIDHAAFSARR